MVIDRLDDRRHRLGGRRDKVVAGHEDRLDRGSPESDPSAGFLTSARIERQPPSSRFPADFDCAPNVAFAITVTTLTALGEMLLVDPVLRPIAKEHATVGGATVLDRDVWLGWLMAAAQVYAGIVPLALWRPKLAAASAAGALSGGERASARKRAGDRRADRRCKAAGARAGARRLLASAKAGARVRLGHVYFVPPETG